MFARCSEVNFKARAFPPFGPPSLPRATPLALYPLLFWLWRPILDLAAGDVDHKLGELGGIAGTFRALLRHGASMPGGAARRQSGLGFALIGVAHYPAPRKLDNALTQNAQPRGGRSERGKRVAR